MGKRIQVFPEQCIGCRICELACSLEKEGQFKPSLSRISIMVSQDDTTCFPAVCLQCEDAPCVEACATGAIERAGSGLVILEEGECTGCGQCVSACPFGSILFDEVTGKAKKCDLCRGDPVCVEFCPTRALRYGEQKEPFSAGGFSPHWYHLFLSSQRAKILPHNP